MDLKYEEKRQKEQHLKLFHQKKKEIRKSEAAKANKQVRKTPTIRSLIKPTKIAEETIQQSLNNLPFNTIK